MSYGFALSFLLWGFSFRNLWNRTWRLGDHKAVELELFHNWGSLFAVEGHYTPKTSLYSHQELSVEFWLASFGTRLAWYDVRHGEERQ